jgi:hypothetical protein
VPRSRKQRNYDQRRHYAAVNRGNKPMIGCLLPILTLVLVVLGVLLVRQRD